MIGHLTGKIIHTDLKSVILDVSGVGYKIHTNTAILANTNTKPENPKSIDGGLGGKSFEKNVDFWTYLAVRETALDLYGFTTKEELAFFELLISVSGIGPISALGILSLASVRDLRHAVISGDTGHLTKVSGIGKKNAEKIVLELKDKLDGTDTDSGSTSNDMDTLEALTSLGYSEREAREALKKIGVETNTGERIKKAIKILS